MDAHRRVAESDPEARGSGEYTDEPAVSVHETAEDRVVFTECDNCDGWIATDLAVELRR